MELLKYSIKDSESFAPFISTMEDTGAEMESSTVMFECDNSAARMLAESLVEFGIMSPLMEAEGASAEPQGPQQQGRRTARGGTGNAGATVNKNVSAQGRNNLKNFRVAAGAGKKKIDPKKLGDSVIDAARRYIEKGEYSLLPEEIVNAVEKLVTDTVRDDADNKGGKSISLVAGDENKIKSMVNRIVASDKGLSEKVKAARDERARHNRAVNDPNKEAVEKDLLANIEKLGLEGEEAELIANKVRSYVLEKAEKDEEYYGKLSSNPRTLGEIVFGVVKRFAPDTYEELKESGKLTDKGENAASVSQKSEISKALSQIVGQVEVPDAFNVEIDDSEWDNALITDYGFPMVNLTSPLVRDMLRAPDPKQQKRAYKAFKKQLGADPDVAKALGIGISGTLGLGGGKKEAKTDKDVRISTEGVNSDGKVLVEGPISDIANALKNPVDVLKSIAQNKGAACRRNNLVVMYKELDGKSGDSGELVKVTPLGVSGGVLVDLNKSAQVPMSHLSAFYSVVDPKASFRSYAKAMAEVNAKSDNAGKGLGDAAAAAGKKLLSKIPLLGSGARKELEAKEADGITKAMGELAMYIKENGHPPFYLLKPKSEPKEVDHWSDEDAANGYQMITMVLDGHKAGMIMKKDTAEALFKVG
jgi:hypothetical protein